MKAPKKHNVRELRQDLLKNNLVTILVQALHDKSRLGLAYSPSKLLYTPEIQNVL